MTRSFLIRGMIAGLVAGLLAFAFAKIFGEPSVDGAIAFEGHHMAGDAGEPELVSRAVQAGLGLFTGIMLYGVALGGLFSLVCAFAYGRVDRLGIRATSALLALGGFVAAILVPFLKYPANPPSVGLAETIGYRTELYFGMIAISIVGMIVAVNLGRSLFGRLNPWHAVGLAALAYIAIVALARFILPDFNEVPADFPATALWQFRTASLGLQVVLWTGLGLVFGELSERGLAPRTSKAKATVRPV